MYIYTYICIYLKFYSKENLFNYHFLHFAYENVLWLSSGNYLLPRKLPLSNTHSRTEGNANVALACKTIEGTIRIFAYDGNNE